MRNKTPVHTLGLPLIVVGILFSILISMANLREFGLYPDGSCAYEQQGLQRVVCPSAMPDKYTTFIVSPQFKLNK